MEEVFYKYDISEFENIINNKTKRENKISEASSFGRKVCV